MRFYAVVAQLAEHLSCKQRVAGSTPVNGFTVFDTSEKPVEATRLDEGAVLKTVGR